MQTMNEIHQSGKGYKAISKALGLQRTTVRSIIPKWKKKKKLAQCQTFPEVVDLPKFLQEHSDDSSRKSQRPKHGTVGTAGLSCISQDHCSWLRCLKDTETKMTSMQQWWGETLTQKNFNAWLNFAKTYLDNPQTSGGMFCGLMYWKLNCLEDHNKFNNRWF